MKRKLFSTAGILLVALCVIYISSKITSDRNYTEKSPNEQVDESYEVQDSSSTESPDTSDEQGHVSPDTYNTEPPDTPDEPESTPSETTTSFGTWANSEIDTPVDIPDAVMTAANNFAQEERDEWRLTVERHNDTEFKILDDCKIEPIEFFYHFDDIEGHAIDLFRFDYWLHTNKPNTVYLMGGMIVNGNWWLPTYEGLTFLAMEVSNPDDPVCLFVFQTDLFLLSDADEEDPLSWDDIMTSIYEDFMAEV